MDIGRVDKGTPHPSTPQRAPLAREGVLASMSDTFEKSSSSKTPVIPPVLHALRAEESSAVNAAHRIEVVSTSPSALWDRIELIRDGNPNFKPENFLEKQKHKNPEIAKAFGTDAPPSTDFLLHYGKGWDTNANPVPVLLVHGATKDAADWVDPGENLDHEPLGAYLADQGFKTFGVTFSHDQGDNFYWEQQIANAIERIKSVTGSDEVDIIAHSKGAVPARMYVSDFHEPWMTPYRGDVRNVVLMGAPNLGIDYAFRHPIINYGLYPETDDPKRDAPMVWDSMVYGGAWRNTRELTLYSDAGDYFPGQRQLLHRWDGRYGISPFEQDWYTTYHGGQGFVSTSRGIDHSIKDSGNLIENLRKAPVNKDVRLFVLAGSHPDIPFIHNEHDGPSDGVCFIESAAYTKDMEKGGAKVFGKAILPVNHMELRYANEAKAWVRGALLNTAVAPPEDLDRTFGESLRKAEKEFSSSSVAAHQAEHEKYAAILAHGATAEPQLQPAAGTASPLEAQAHDGFLVAPGKKPD